MSVSQLLVPNDLTVYADNINASLINGIEGNIIDPEVNEVGQVLTITSLNPKSVQFQDPQGGTPPTLGEPDGYVLAIKDNTTGELEWKQDAQGSIPDPLVLSGANNANKFQVKNNAGDNKFTVNTLADRVDINADTIEMTATNTAVMTGNLASVIQTLGGPIFINSSVGNTEIDGSNISLTATNSVEVDGADNANKFQVRDATNNPLFTVDTVSKKIDVRNLSGDTTFQVSLTGDTTIGNQSGDTQFNFFPNLNNVVLDTVGITPIKQTISNSSAGPNSLELISNADGTTEIKATNELKVSATTSRFTQTNFIVDGVDDVKKFSVYNSGDVVPVFNVNNAGFETTAYGKLYVGANPERNDAFEVARKTDGYVVFGVDTLNKKIDLNKNDGLKNGSIKFLDTPETLPVGVNSAVNMSLESDGGGAGNANFVGYIAENGPNSVYNLVNNVSTGLFFVAPSAGISTTADTLTINSTGNPNGKLVALFPDSIELTRDGTNQSFRLLNNGVVEVKKSDDAFFRINNNEFTQIGTTNTFQVEANRIDLISNGVLNINSQSQTNVFNDIVFDVGTSTNPPRYAGLLNKYTNNADMTNKLYVDDRVGGLSSGTFGSNQALGNVGTPQSLNPIAFLPNPPVTPANYLKAGQSYQLVMSGTAQFSNGNDFTMTLVASNGGAPVTLGTVQIIVPNVSGAQTWELEADFTIRSVVANIANIFCSFDFTYNDGQAFVGKRALTSTNSLNTTLSQTLTTNVTFTTGTGADNITTELYILKKVVDV